MSKVQQQFLNVAKARCSHGLNNMLSSRDFEAHAGITGISAYYIFPGNMSVTRFANHIDRMDYPSRTFQHYSFDEGDNFVLTSTPDPVLLAQMLKDWNDLIALNPELKKIKVDKGSPKELFDCLAGVASQYNADDINHYLTRSRLGFPKDSADTDQLKTAIELTAGAAMEWDASPKTLKVIKAALEAKTGKPIDWATTPENKRKIQKFMLERWADPTDAPEITAKLKALTEGPFGSVVNTLDSQPNAFYSYLKAKDLKAIQRMLFKDLPRPYKQEKLSLN
jgi:hypothetical protein